MTGTRGGRGHPLAPYLFLLPNMLIFGLFTIGPAIYSFVLSAFSTSPFRDTRFVGLDNYAVLLENDEFHAAVGNTLVFVLAFSVISTVVAVLLGVALNGRIRGRDLFRGAIFLPVLLSPVVVALVWRWILDREVGLVNAGLEAIGIAGPAWLLEGRLTMGAVVLIGVWTHVGFYALIVLAGLQAIDRYVYEAADIDGAGAWDRFWSITLPLLAPSVLVVLILSLIAGFQSFDYIFVLTGGGPAGATQLWVQFIYETAFSQFRFGLASAASVLLFGIVFVATLAQFRFARMRGAA